MIGKIKLNRQSGLDINGITEEYISGENIKAGQFVKLVSNKIQKITSSTDKILGIAKTSATTEQTAQVIVPNLV